MNILYFPFVLTFVSKRDLPVSLVLLSDLDLQWDQELPAKTVENAIFSPFIIVDIVIIKSISQ